MNKYNGLSFTILQCCNIAAKIIKATYNKKPKKYWLKTWLPKIEFSFIEFSFSDINDLGDYTADHAYAQISTGVGKNFAIKNIYSHETQNYFYAFIGDE
ncbi:MAG: hypothetical protein IPH58_01760 [Sphingobacteriales bacterium]|nr:hypothetical protein [Sphingobacteriales bacterium]